jgi:hypothetical protein
VQVAVAKLQLDAIEQQGKAALDLIKSGAPPEVVAAATPPPNAAAHVGAHLNVVA